MITRCQALAQEVSDPSIGIGKFGTSPDLRDDIITIANTVNNTDLLLYIRVVLRRAPIVYMPQPLHFTLISAKEQTQADLPSAIKTDHGAGYKIPSRSNSPI